MAAAMDAAETAWMWEHYEIRYRSGTTDDGTLRDPAYIACKRCGMEVYGITTHARNVHGDNVEAKPPALGNLIRGWSSDAEGRKVVSRPLLTTADYLAQDALLP